MHPIYQFICILPYLIILFCNIAFSMDKEESECDAATAIPAVAESSVLEPFSGKGIRGLFSDKPSFSNASDGFSARITDDAIPSLGISAKARPLPSLSERDVTSFEESLLAIRTAFEGRISQCFISRAWEEDPDHQNHVFAKRLCTDLNKAGIRTIIDENDLRVGESIAHYIQQIDHDDVFVLVLFTPTYKNRMLNPDSWIKKEVDLIQKRLERNDFFYIPLLCEGEPAESIPHCLSPQDRLFRNFQIEHDYNRNILDILNKKILHPEKLNVSKWKKVSKSLIAFYVPSFISQPFIESAGLTGDGSYLGRIWRVLNKSPAGLNKCVLTGMGGVGKTQLALKYALDAKENGAYDLIFWLNSDTEENMMHSCRTLINALNPAINHLKLQQMDRISLQTQLTNDLAIKTEKWLLIYDNVVKEYEPIFPADGGHILITSRLSIEWDFPDQISVDVFSTEESLDYLIQKTGPPLLENQKTSMNDIIGELGHLPLALSHAASYIKKKRITFQEYNDALKKGLMNHFLVHPNEILRQKAINMTQGTEIEQKNIQEEMIHYAKQHDLYPFSVTLSLGLSLALLSSLDRYIFSHLCNCDPFQIHLDTLKFMPTSFEQLETIPFSGLKDSILNLADYSIISYDYEKNSVSIHRLVQQVEQRSHVHTLQILENLTFSWLMFLEHVYQHYHHRIKDELYIFQTYLNQMIHHQHKNVITLTKIKKKASEALKKERSIIELGYQILNKEVNYLLYFLSLFIADIESNTLNPQNLHNFIKSNLELDNTKMKLLVEEANEITHGSTTGAYLYLIVKILSSLDDHVRIHVISWFTNFIKRIEDPYNLVDLLLVVSSPYFFTDEEFKTSLENQLIGSETIHWIDIQSNEKFKEILKKTQKTVSYKFYLDFNPEVIKSHTWKNAAFKAMPLFTSCMTSNNVMELIEFVKPICDEQWALCLHKALPLLSDSMTIHGITNVLTSFLNPVTIMESECILSRASELMRENMDGHDKAELINKATMFSESEWDIAVRRIKPLTENFQFSGQDIAILLSFSKDTTQLKWDETFAKVVMLLTEEMLSYDFIPLFDVAFNTENEIWHTAISRIQPLLTDSRQGIDCALLIEEVRSMSQEEWDFILSELQPNLEADMELYDILPIIGLLRQSFYAV